MDEHRKRRLMDAGVDVDEALERFLGNEALLMKFLQRFPSDRSFPKLREAMAQGDAAAAFEAAHTLKGVAGNLSLTAVHQAACAVVEDLRQGDLRKAESKMPTLERAYERLAAAVTLPE